jgi:hypothetical protein
MTIPVLPRLLEVLQQEAALYCYRVPSPAHDRHGLCITAGAQHVARRCSVRSRGVNSRESACWHAGGRGFESPRLHRNTQYPFPRGLPLLRADVSRASPPRSQAGCPLLGSSPSASCDVHYIGLFAPTQLLALVLLRSRWLGHEASPASSGSRIPRVEDPGDCRSVPKVELRLRDRGPGLTQGRIWSSSLPGLSSAAHRASVKCHPWTTFYTTTEQGGRERKRVGRAHAAMLGPLPLSGAPALCAAGSPDSRAANGTRSRCR